MESLYKITYPNYDVIIVDNGSEDDSLKKINEYCKGNIPIESNFFEYSKENKPIKIVEYSRNEAENGGGKEKEIEDLPSNRKLIIIKNEKNYGFAEGNNIGMRYALRALKPDYILLLNNDTIVDREFLEKLIKVAEGNEKIGILGPIIYYYPPKGGKEVIWFAGGKVIKRIAQPFHIGLNEIDRGQYSGIRPVDYITGCALLIKKNVIKEIGFLDRDYFAYFEDLDWNLKAHEKGFIAATVSDAHIWHKGSSTSGHMSALYVYLHIRNRILFAKKNMSKFSFIFFFLPIFLFIRIPYIKISSLIRGSRKKEVIRAVFLGIKDGLLNTDIEIVERLKLLANK